MTLPDFLDCHTSSELTEVVIRDRLDPFDAAGRLEKMLARLIALIFNIKRDPNASEALSADDFTPIHGRQYRDQAEAAEEQTIMTPRQMNDAMASMRAQEVGQSMLRIRTILKPSGAKGLGLYCTDRVRAGTLIWAYDPGIDQELTRGVFRTRLQRTLRDTYCTQQPDGTFQLCADNARFMNHADKPNTSSQKDDFGRVIGMVAARTIAADEELTCDYREQCESARCQLGFTPLQ